MTESVREHFKQDHERLDGLFESFRSSKRSNAAEAKEAFKAFKSGLQRHIVWEEDVLFPLWEEKCGMRDGGPTMVMRAEHRQIGEQLEAIHDKVARHDANSDPEEQALHDLLRAHNRKEEDVLYPAIDRVTQPDERAELFRKLERLPAERYAVCCGAHHKSSSEPL